MKRISLYLTILLIPIILIILLNEGIRWTIDDQGYKTEGILAINSRKKIPEKCTWVCHNNTEYCKNNHVQVLGNKFDGLYFEVINSFKSTGQYRLANIFFLAFVIPLFNYFLIIRILNTQERIKKLKLKS